MASLELLIDEVSKIAVRSLHDDRLSRFPDQIAVGDTLPLSVGIVDRIQSPWTSRKFTPQALTSTTFRAALGGGFLSPVAGKTTATFEAADTTTQTTEELSFGQTSFNDVDLELVLNALSKVLAIGGVSVDQPNLSDSFFVITFNNVGARNLLSFDVGNLVPTSVADVARAATGDVDTREVQTVRFTQNAGAIVTLDDAAASAAATITSVTTGSGSANAQWRLALTGNIYKGSFTVAKTTGTTGTSATIPFDDTEAQIKAKLEATTGIGTGNVSVLQEDERTYLIEFIGSLALTAITLTVNGTNLTAIPELTGTLDLRTPGIQMLLNGSNEKWVTLEIEKTVGSDPPVKIFSRDILLVNPVIEASMTEQLFAGPTQSGLTAIGSGVDLIAVVFPQEFASVPTQIMAIVEKPSGGDNIFATVRRDTISTTGFTAELSGATPDANHKLSWVAIL